MRYEVDCQTELNEDMSSFKISGGERLFYPEQSLETIPQMM